MKKNDFPECPVPLISTVSHYENFKGDCASFNTDFKKSIFIKFGDAIPTHPPEGQREMIIERLGEEHTKILEEFLEEIFKKSPIIKSRDIQEIFDKTIASRIKKTTYLKLCISLFSYYFESGPWRGYRIRLGYDPRTDSSNYKFQVLLFNHVVVNISDYPDIIAEVEANRDAYILKECDPVNGFVSEAFKKLIMFKLQL